MTSASVLIPCHNGAAWIRHAIESALAAEHVAEVIVMDDGSTDGSAEIADAFANRILFHRQAAMGGNVARNAALRLAQADWIQFLDADDYLEPQKIARQLAEAGDLASADVLYSPVWIETWRDGRAVERTASALDADSDLWTQWITWQLPQTGGALWRRDALERIGGWNENQPCCQDHELYLRALQAGLRFRFCPTPGAVYRIWSEETVCRRDPIRVIRERTRLIDSALQWLDRRHARTPEHTQAAAQAAFEMARTWARYDLSAAAAYFDERRRRVGVRARGPAAPLKYRLALQLLGFRRAERFARRLR